MRLLFRVIVVMAIGYMLYYSVGPQKSKNQQRQEAAERTSDAKKDIEKSISKYQKKLGESLDNSGVSD